jgi:hypothetical protein
MVKRDERMKLMIAARGIGLFCRGEMFDPGGLRPHARLLSFFFRLTFVQKVKR